MLFLWLLIAATHAHAKDQWRNGDLCDFGDSNNTYEPCVQYIDDDTIKNDKKTNNASEYTTKWRSMTRNKTISFKLTQSHEYDGRGSSWSYGELDGQSAVKVSIFNGRDEYTTLDLKHHFTWTNDYDLRTALINRALAARERHGMLSSMTEQEEHIGQCFKTRVKWVSGRIGYNYRHWDVAGLSDGIGYDDGHTNWDYGPIKAMQLTRKGDPVELCVYSFPKDCPIEFPDDTRGIVYRVTNFRNHKHWISSDSLHQCGGA